MNGLRLLSNNGQHPDEGGQTLVEFALVAAILLAVVLGGVGGIDLLAEQAAVESITRNTARMIAERGALDVDTQGAVRQQMDAHGIPRDEAYLLVHAYENVVDMEASANRIYSGRDDLWEEPRWSGSVTSARCGDYGSVIEVILVRPVSFNVPIAGLFIDPFMFEGEKETVHIDRCWRSGSSQ